MYLAITCQFWPFAHIPSAIFCIINVCLRCGTSQRHSSPGICLIIFDTKITVVKRRRPWQRLLSGRSAMSRGHMWDGSTDAGRLRDTGQFDINGVLSTVETSFSLKHQHFNALNVLSLAFRRNIYIVINIPTPWLCYHQCFDILFSFLLRYQLGVTHAWEYACIFILNLLNCCISDEYDLCIRIHVYIYIDIII